jgi:hypothetical protein
MPAPYPRSFTRPSMLTKTEIPSFANLGVTIKDGRNSLTNLANTIDLHRGRDYMVGMARQKAVGNPAPRTAEIRQPWQAQTPRHNQMDLARSSERIEALSIQTQIDRGQRIAAAAKRLKAKRGDIVAVKVRHSSTAMQGATTVDWSWQFAKAAHVNRDGVVMSVTMGDVEHRTNHTGGRFVPLTITGPAHQAAARAAFNADPGREYADEAAIRSAVVSRLGVGATR